MHPLTTDFMVIGSLSRLSLFSFILSPFSPPFTVHSPKKEHCCHTTLQYRLALTGMTAKTNLMRLSAGLRGYDNVSIALVDCDSSSARQLCYEEQQIPAAPHAPVVKGYQSGEKYAGTVGEALYNSNEMEPHLALEIMERLVRLILSDRIKSSSAVSDGTLSGFEKNRKEEEEKEKDHNPPPRKMWNGPPPRGPLPWGGGGGGGMSRTALGH